MTQTADGQPLHGPQIIKAADFGSQEPLTSSHEAVRAYMDAYRDDDRCDDEEWDEDDEGQDDKVAAPDAGKALAGHQADSPGSSWRAGTISATLRGQHSIEALGGIRVERVNCQELRPQRLAELHTAGHEASGSSMHDNRGSVTVQSLNQAAASANSPLPGSASAKPKRPVFGPAPTGHGERFGKTPSRSAGRSGY